MDYLAQVLRWNERSFQMLYNDYYKALVVCAIQIVTDKSVSEDIVQEMFSRLYERKLKFESVSSLRSYLYNSVRNLCLDWLRHRKVEESYLKTMMAKAREYPVSEDGEDGLFSEEIYRRLEDFFNDLPPRQHEIMLLAIEGKKNSEIAEILGVKVGTIKTQKQRALNTLRENFNPEIYLAVCCLVV